MISVNERLPIKGQLLLVEVVGGESLCLATFDQDRDGDARWYVQPYRAAWYSADANVTAWMPVDGDLELVDTTFKEFVEELAQYVVMRSDHLDHRRGGIPGSKQEIDETVVKLSRLFQDVLRNVGQR